MTDVRCKTCDQGVLTLQKVHRMSGPAVTIGYLLLIPSLLGIAFAMFFFIMSMVGAVSVAQEKLSATTIQRLHDTNVPADLVTELEAGKMLSAAKKEGLNADQAAAVTAAETELNARAGATGCLGACGTGMAATIAVLSFIGGLLGWLLVMKKRILVCSACSAVMNAS
jgi:hypothetical protein